MAWYNWSQTASANASADPSVNWAEGQAPSSINDSARAMMAATAKYRDDIAGAIVTGGSSTAYTVASNSNFDTLPHLSGQIIAFTPHVTNGATVLLNVDGLGQKPLRTAPGVELQAGVLIQGTPYVALYNSTDGAFYLQGFYGNPYNIPLGGGMLYTGPTAPNSAFVFPSGQAISRTTYAAYFTLIGTTFGVGDGSTTFNVLDLRGRVPCGVDNMNGSSGGLLPGFNLGVTAGAQTAALIAANNGPHNHGGATGTESASHTHQTSTTSAVVGGVTGGSATGGIQTPQGAANINTFNTGAESANHTHSIPSDGSGTPFSILQPTIACNYILRII